MLSNLINRPCTLLLRPDDEEIDEFSDDPRPEPEQVETVCELQQIRRDESERQGESSETTWTLFFLTDVEDLVSAAVSRPLRTRDAVAVEGDLYELVGDPWVARNPLTQVFSHVEATARFVGTEVGS